MYKLTRKEMKILRNLGETLPKTFYMASEVHRMKGRDLLLDKNIDASKIKGGVKPDNIYEVKVPTKHLVNHNSRLLTAFESGGMAAVDEYCTGVMDLVELQFKVKGIVPAEMATPHKIFATC